MTQHELDKLTPEQRCIRIAVATGRWLVRSYGPYNMLVPAGYEEFERSSWGPPHKDKPVESLQHRFTMYKHFVVPDYLNDLNAMHEAEKVFKNHKGMFNAKWGSTSNVWMHYRHELNMICGGDVNSTREAAIFHATAAQRAAAFLLAVG